MTDTAPTGVTSALFSVVVGVTDLAAATPQYTALFGAPHTEMPFYVGYRVGDVEVGLNPSPDDGVTGPVAYWHVADLAAAEQALTTAGARVVSPAKEVGGGATIEVLADAEGNLIGLMHGTG